MTMQRYFPAQALIGCLLARRRASFLPARSIRGRPARRFTYSTRLQKRILFAVFQPWPFSVVFVRAYPLRALSYSSLKAENILPVLAADCCLEEALVAEAPLAEDPWEEAGFFAA